jgi:hypothetical protein
VKFFRLIRLSLTGLVAVAALSGCGDNANPVAPSPELDTTPPPAPENLTLAADANGHPLLVWSASSAPDVVGYWVYVNAQTDGGGHAYVPAIDLICSDNSFYLPTVTAPEQASYRVRALDGAGNWSAYSATADITIPVPGGTFDIP